MATIDEILSDPYFAKLDKELAKFNIFHATDMKNREIKHTKFLGYLLDPNESHQLGTQLLWTFLRKISAAGVKDLDLINLNTQYTKVHIEYEINRKSLDLLIEIPTVDGRLLVLAIENKIKATEAPGQLDCYFNGINEKFNTNEIKKFIYLTLNEDNPSNVNWINITYENTIIPAIRELTSNSEETLSNYLRLILQDYIEVIEKDDDQTSSAFDIYELINDKIKLKIKGIKNPKIHSPEYKLQLIYPRAFDYVKNYDDDPRLKILEKFREIFSQSTILQLETSNRTYLNFSLLDPKVQEFLVNGICSSSAAKGMESKRNIAFQIEVRNHPTNPNLVLLSTRLNLGPTNENFSLRREICSKIREKFNGGSINNAGPAHTRIINFETNKEILISEIPKKLEEIKTKYETKGRKKSEIITESIRDFIHENTNQLRAIGIDDEILKNFISPPLAE